MDQHTQYSQGISIENSYPQVFTARVKCKTLAFGDDLCHMLKVIQRFSQRSSSPKVEVLHLQHR
jgi:hypothetical protein